MLLMGDVCLRRGPDFPQLSAGIPKLPDALIAEAFSDLRLRER